MVIRIEKPNKDIANTLAYNERKAGPQADEQTGGTTLATENVPEGTDFESEVKRLVTLNKKRGRAAKDVTFHMSVNPAGGELPDDERATMMIKELMSGLGYGDTPFRIYKHTDIARRHYHVVACRIGQDGRKIKDSFEERRAMALGRILGEKYGFVMGLADDADEEEKEPAEEQEEKPQTEEEYEEETRIGTEGDDEENDDWYDDDDLPPEDDGWSDDEEEERDDLAFDAASRDDGTLSQIAKAHAAALKWHFTTRAQYAAIMAVRYRIDAEEGYTGFLYAGLDGDGERATHPQTQWDAIGRDAAKEADERARACAREQTVWQRKKIARAAEAEATKAKTYQDWKRTLRKNHGITPILSFAENGQAFGLTWIDARTKCAFKGSETSADMDWLRAMATKKGWRLPTKGEEKARAKKSELRRSGTAARKNAHTVSARRKDAEGKRTMKAEEPKLRKKRQGRKTSSKDIIRQSVRKVRNGRPRSIFDDVLAELAGHRMGGGGIHTPGFANPLPDDDIFRQRRRRDDEEEERQNGEDMSI